MSHRKFTSFIFPILSSVHSTSRVSKAAYTTLCSKACGEVGNVIVKIYHVTLSTSLELRLVSCYNSLKNITFMRERC